MTMFLGLLLGIGATLVALSVLSPRPPEPAVSARVSATARLSRHARALLTQAGMPRVRLSTLVILSVVFAIAVGAVVLSVFPIPALGCASASVALVLPWVILNSRARAHRRATRVVWPDVVDHLVSAVRSGLALPDSVVALAQVGPGPTRLAFAEFERNYRASGNFADAIDRLKATLADPVADRIIETLRMSREVGGTELTTVLRGLAAYLRHDASIRQEVEARQSWTVNAARLGVAAPWIVLALLATRPEAVRAYDSPSGAVLILSCLVVSVVAYRIMLGLGRLPEQRRWFE